VAPPAGKTPEVLDEVRDLDVPELLAVDPGLARVPVEKARELHCDPAGGCAQYVT
jgi:hypothetical protein